jgi:hypothetical protein
MTRQGEIDDIRAIESMISPLYPAARPARPSTAEDFIERMNGLSRTELRSFKSTFMGARIHVFGNVAVAFAVCEMVENETDTIRGIEAFLLIIPLVIELDPSRSPTRPPMSIRSRGWPGGGAGRPGVGLYGRWYKRPRQVANWGADLGHRGRGKPYSRKFPVPGNKTQLIHHPPVSAGGAGGRRPRVGR